MHTIKVAVLLILTLAVMRAASWLVGWLIHLVLKRTTPGSSLAANALALGAFVGLLVWNLMPGESFDYSHLGFGIVVYTVCLLIDLKWYPWKRRSGSSPPAE